MPSSAEIEDLLRDGDLLTQIGRNLASSTIALFAIDYEHGNERLKLTGTGTLSAAGKYHGILTAAHVWEVLQSAVRVGITRTDKLNHRYVIDVATIIPTVLKKPPTKWDECGPDLVFLQIPKEHVGTIEASQVFENLQKPPKMLGVEAIECWVVMGVPGELGIFTQSHASVEINTSLVNPQYISGTPDYYEFQVDTTGPGIPNSYGGFSGGGLWRVVLYSSPSTGKVDWEQRLKGVLFWQFPEVKGRRIIRCHGQESILALLEQAKSE